MTRNQVFTEGERVYLSRKPYSPEQEAFGLLSETAIVGTFVLLFMLFVVCGVFWYHIVRADEDTTACLAWANGAQVSGASDGDVADYCNSL